MIPGAATSIDRPSLVMEGGPDRDAVYPLGDKVTLGRLPSSDVVVADRGVSREHALVFKTGAGYSLRDLASSNGTFVNSNNIAAEDYQLKDGDRVLLGVSEVTLVFRSPESDTMQLTAVGLAVGAATLSSPGTMVVDIPDQSDPGGDPGQPGGEAQLYEGNVRLNVMAEGSLGLVVQLTQQLREKPELRLLRLGNNEASGVDIWLGLREPVPLELVLLALPGVVEAAPGANGDATTLTVLLRG